MDGKNDLQQTPSFCLARSIFHVWSEKKMKLYKP